ncbi:hypothetical protein QTP88_006730 [Uroleucon formosanum]
MTCLWNLYSFVVDKIFKDEEFWKNNIESQFITQLYADVYRRSKTEIRKWLRNIFSLSFLNAVEVGESYTDDFMSTIPENHAVHEFSDYLVDNYISDGLFPPHIWASDTISSQRTTNACESFHAKFNKSFSSPHPNIFVFIDVLTQLQIYTYILMQNTDTIPSTTQYQKKINNIEKYIDLYTQKRITRVEFLNAVCYYYKK